MFLKANVEADETKGMTAEEIRKQEEEKEEEEKRAQRSMGTPVTKENFIAWKNKFDAEQALLKSKQVLLTCVRVKLSTIIDL